VNRPADAEPLGALLAATVLTTSRQAVPSEASALRVRQEVISIPRATDYERRIAAIQAEQHKLVAALKPVNLNFKNFLPLLLQQKLDPAFPSHSAHSYLHDESLGREGLRQLDSDNRASVEAYLANLASMEELTRLNTNLALLKRHQAQTEATGASALEAEVCGLRIGDFKLVTFPGELTVEVGLNIQKDSADPNAFISGYTNGYLYYTATMAQRRNTGYAQEDCDTLVAPEWQPIFEAKALEILKDLSR
jgi:hypothetical protein